MQAFIPSTKRVDRQTTFNAINHAIDTTIVVPLEEYNSYSSKFTGHVLACPAKGIAPTRDWIIQYCIDNKIDKFVMFDDDVTPQIRDEDMKIRNSTPAEIQSAINWLEQSLDSYAHASWSVRSLDFDTPGDHKIAGRMMHVLSYRTEVLESYNFKCCNGVDDTHVMDDFNLTLQLLTNGFPNCISLLYRSNVSASNSKGGASTWRTLDIHNKSAKRMAELFPNFVKLREKKNWQGMEGVQYDVTVQWQKALKWGKDNANHN
jgi:hypothetical protein